VKQANGILTEVEIAKRVLKLVAHRYEFTHEFEVSTFFMNDGYQRDAVDQTRALVLSLC